MKKIMLILLTSMCLLIMLLSSYLIGKKSVTIPPTVEKIGIEEYRDLIASKKEFILYIGRSSCHYCAIVSASLDNFVDQGIPIYSLELEQYYPSKEYDSIKAELGIVYVPSFRYIKNGDAVYNMNSPLNDQYYESGSNRTQMRVEMESKILAFIRGALGTGEVVNEKIKTDKIDAEAVSTVD
jgi:predicted bacteriocin transport accessory protein